MFIDTTSIAEATGEAECRDKGQAGSRREGQRIGDRGGQKDDAQEILISLFHNFNRPVMAG
jgi:hypothetical protein